MSLAGRYVLDDLDTARFRLGPLELWAWCRPNEWRLASHHEADPLLDRSEVTVPAGPWSPPTGAKVERFAAHPEDHELALSLRLADRDVVVRPDPPVHLLPGDAIEVFVGTPLWLTIENEHGRKLTEVPTARMPQTWFGPSPREGELCYALRSKARLSKDEMPRRANRALTVLSIRNEGDDVLVLERLKVPLPHLALYEGADGTLWTQEVTVVRSSRDDARVQVAADAPVTAGDVTRIADARRSGIPSMLARAFGALLS